YVVGGIVGVEGDSARGGDRAAECEILTQRIVAGAGDVARGVVFGGDGELDGPFGALVGALGDGECAVVRGRDVGKGTEHGQYGGCYPKVIVGIGVHDGVGQ